ncbi:MAG TPA: zf-TFIIB domain-containing protein [Acidimicrobiia bacterium]|nr:zf-TFIIB domain-containing protein [Acidimicrobiia bacterium]
MQCPVDGTTLAMADRQGVEVDYCPQCRGVWLDRGELDKLIDREAEAAPAPPSREYERERPRYRDDDDDDRHVGGFGGGHKRKKKGFLSEIFEFGE